MADYTIGDIRPMAVNPTSDIKFVKFGEAGCAVKKTAYQDLSDATRRWKLAINDDTAAKARMGGLIIMGGTLENDYGMVAVGGLWDLDASIPEGESVVLSNTAGGIGPPTDLATDEYISTLGTQGKTAFKIDINNTGETAT